MIKNYIIVSWRNLVRNKLHTCINIIGLMIGVASCLVLYLIASHELSFNKEMKDYDRIYRVVSSFADHRAVFNRGVPTGVAPAIRDKFSGVENVVLGEELDTKVIINSSTIQKKFDRQHTVLITEPSYFSVFGSYEWIAGSPGALDKPFQGVITESKALLYFNTADPDAVLGKEIIYQDSLAITVAGIVRDLPFNTDIDFTDFISLETVNNSFLRNNFRLNEWRGVSSATITFLKAAPGTGRANIEKQFKQIDDFYLKAAGDDFKVFFRVNPLADLHYNTEAGIFDHSRDAAHLPTLLTLIGVSFALLVIAGINFINLETARSTTRAREVGVRKVMGGRRSQLVFQFMTEGLIVTAIAVIAALPLARLLLNFFSEFTPIGMTVDPLRATVFLVLVIGVIGLLAGFYPAWIQSSFKPVLALKGQSQLADRKTGVSIRSILIVFQFVIAQFFICATLLFASQIRFLLDRDLGFKSDAVIYFKAPWQESKNKIQLLKNELVRVSEIKEMTMSSDTPSANGWITYAFDYKAPDGTIKIVSFVKLGDPQYIGFYRMKLLAGRNLQPSNAINEVIINETLMHRMGIKTPADAAGTIIDFNGQHWPVVGVVKDFNVQSLHKTIEPVMIANDVQNEACFNLRLASEGKRGDEFNRTLATVETAWKKIYPDYPLSYEFLDETIRNFYQSEQRSSKLVKTSAILAIFISCLGLFGLASYSAAKRTKEIGIRKVLGASVRSIIVLMSRDFVRLVSIAFIIATPITWYVAKSWLQGYPYHVEMGATLFICTFALALLVALLTVSFQIARSASINPTECLRNE
jgi:putative ABC transport system permease protein